jgi:3-isopropylmalate/(R)-2-methylmalate dehydratase small subunit
MSEGFVNFSGIAAAMPAANINTDAIIPIPWMRTAHADLGKGLFAVQRYDDVGKERPEFILNRQPFRSASILLGGENFGCGSSREAAVWALVQFGIKCVFAPSFADIFYENAFRNGLVAGIIDKSDLEACIAISSEEGGDPVFAVDLLNGTLTHAKGCQTRFRIAASRRDALIRGDDEIGLTLRYADDIAAFHAKGLANYPWLHAPLTSKVST